MDQIRTATVVFVDLVSYSKISLQLADHPERLKQIVTEFSRRCRVQVESHHGFIVKFMGDCTMAVFGAPLSRENDPLHAVHAGWALMRSVRAMAPPFPGSTMDARIGMATGDVVLRHDEDYAQSFDLFGPTVNLAARLQGAAAPGEILMDAATRAFVDGACQCEATPPLRLKNVSDAFIAYRCVALSKAASVKAAGEMIGRNTELGVLRAWRLGLRPDQTHLIWVHGEAGIGKSMLLNAFAREHDPYRLVYLAGQSHRRQHPFAPLLDWLQALVAQSTTAFGSNLSETGLRAWFDLAPHTRGFGADEFALLHQLIASAQESEFAHSAPPEVISNNLPGVLLQLMRNGGAPSSIPLLLIIDQADHLDDCTWTWLQKVISMPPPEGLGIALACRHEGQIHSLSQQIDHIERLELAAMPAAELQALAASWEAQLESAAISELYPLLASRAHGNPLLLRELISLATAQSVAVLSADRLAAEFSDLPTVALRSAEESIPPRLVHLIQARFDALCPAEQAALATGAIPGRSFTAAWLASAGTATNQETLIHLVKKNLLASVESGHMATYEFSHAAEREVIYGMLDPDRRQALHGLFVEYIQAQGRETVEHAEELARHLQLAGQSRRAVPWLLHAAQRAQAFGAARNALMHYQSVLDALEGDSELALTDRQRYWKARIELAALRRQMGEPATAHALLRGSDSLREDQPLCDFFVRACNELAILHLWECQYTECAVYAEKVLVIEQQRGCGAASPLSSVARVTRGICAWRQGELDIALNLFTELAHLYAEADSPRELFQLVDALNNRMLVLWHMGRLAEADQQAGELLRKASRLHDQFRLAAFLNNHGILKEQRGKVHEALELYDRASRLARKVGNIQVRAAVENNLANLYRRIEDYQTALTHSLRSVELNQRLGQAGQLAEAWHNLALARAAQRNWTEAQSAFNAAGQQASLAGDERELAWLWLDQAVHSAHLPRFEPDFNTAMSHLAEIQASIAAKGWGDLRALLVRSRLALALRFGTEPALELKPLCQMALELEENTPLEALACWRMVQSVAPALAMESDADERIHTLLNRMHLLVESY